mmetsp:Transcript_15878/g.28126  ORF Transcript_15878/g.28126 Transcript_15878/m.28126 type:complete len:688 (-) Transcript_15878:365-2428(-)
MDADQLDESFAWVKRRAEVMVALRKDPGIALMTMEVFNELFHFITQQVHVSREGALAILRGAKPLAVEGDHDRDWAQKMRFLHASAALPPQVIGTRRHFDDVVAEALVHAKIAEAQIAGIPTSILDGGFPKLKKVMTTASQLFAFAGMCARLLPGLAPEVAEVSHSVATGLATKTRGILVDLVGKESEDAEVTAGLWCISAQFIGTCETVAQLPAIAVFFEKYLVDCILGWFVRTWRALDSAFQDLFYLLDSTLTAPKIPFFLASSPEFQNPPDSRGQPSEAPFFAFSTGRQEDQKSDAPHKSKVISVLLRMAARVSKKPATPSSRGTVVSQDSQAEDSSTQMSSDDQIENSTATAASAASVRQSGPVCIHCIFDAVEQLKCLQDSYAGLKESLSQMKNDVDGQTVLQRVVERFWLHEPEKLTGALFRAPDQGLLLEFKSRMVSCLSKSHVEVKELQDVMVLAMEAAVLDNYVDSGEPFDGIRLRISNKINQLKLLALGSLNIKDIKFWLEKEPHPAEPTEKHDFVMALKDRLQTETSLLRQEVQLLVVDISATQAVTMLMSSIGKLQLVVEMYDSLPEQSVKLSSIVGEVKEGLVDKVKGLAVSLHASLDEMDFMASNQIISSLVIMSHLFDEESKQAIIALAKRGRRLIKDKLEQLGEPYMRPCEVGIADGSGQGEWLWVEFAGE